MVGAAALIAVVSGAGIIGHAAAASKQLHSTRPGLAARALEPGFTGTFLYRNDNFRTGQNLAESILTPSTVNPTQFGLLFTDTIDGAAYAQPLYVPNVAIPNQGTHNVIYVATENDSVYAFDADQPGPALWQKSFIDPANGITAVPASDLECGDLAPIIGITATPVIDPGRRTERNAVRSVQGQAGAGQLSAAASCTRHRDRPRAGAQSDDDCGERAGNRGGRGRWRDFV